MTSMDDDIDIYEDLPSFEISHNENFASNNEGKIVGEQVQLKKEIAELVTKLENCQKVNKNLEINLFSLLKTAKAEIARKDKMIHELKKKLDDITLKKSIYFKPNNYIVHKSAFTGTNVNVQQKLPDVCLFPNETDIDAPLVDYTYKQTNKESQSKSSLLPVVTVFGERLLKRIVDEQNLESKDKQTSKSNDGNEAVSENAEGYVVESDKENGSLGNTNICDTKDIQSSTIALYQENEHIKKSLVTISNVISKDLHLNNNSNSNETKGKYDEKSTLANNYSGKRTSEDANHISVKRKRSSAEECFSKPLKREIVNDVTLEAREKYTFPSPRYINLESSGNFRWYNRDSSVEMKKHSYFNDNTNKKEEKKDLKDKSGSDVSVATCEKRETSERFSKRYNKSTENFTLEERNSGYRSCTDTVLKRNDYRANHSEHRKSKQREYHRTEDYRSRLKSASYTKCREEKYGRNQHNKHAISSTTSSYEERLEKPYNFRKAAVSSDKSRQLFNNKKDSFNGRSMSKHSTDQKASNVKKDDRSTDYDCSDRRSKKDNDKTLKREKKLFTEYNHKFNAEKSNEHSKYVSVSERNVKKNDLIIKHIDDRTTKTEQKVGIDEELGKYAEKELEDGEISSSSSSINDKQHERLKDQRSDLPHGESVRRDSVTSTESLKSDGKAIETVEDRLKMSSETDLPNIGDAFLKKQENSENVEKMENVENVENIEKFIRDYTSKNDEMFDVISVMSNTSTISHKPLTDVSRPVENDTSALNKVSSNSVETSEECRAVLTSNEIVCVDETLETNEQLFTIRSPNDDNNADDEDDDDATDRSATQKHQRSQFKSENIVEDYDLQNVCRFPSTVLPDSFTETDKQKVHDNVKIATSDDVANKYDYNTCNNRIENIINENSNSAEDKTAPTTTVIAVKSENKNTNVKLDMTQQKRMCKLAMQRGDTQLQENEKLSQNRNQIRNTVKNTSMDVHGKMVLYTRRKKPVCLENSNANMTVLVNNKYNDNVHSSNMNDKTTV